MKANETIKELFFDYPTKHWHFEKLLKEAGLSRAQTNAWLKKLSNEGIIKRIKPKGKMPYYIATYESPHYRNTKRIFALTKLHQSGLLDYLASLEKAKTVIVFGSFTRGDWYKDSDIDLFIYGSVPYLRVGKYLSNLKREIQIFSGKDSKDLKKMGPALLKNIIKGITIKGDIPKEVLKHAAI
jgi:predicted nucleotidyltransferase